MVDFKKLMHRTPEERAAAMEVLDREYAEREAAKIVLLTTKVRALEQVSGTLTAYEGGFVRDMAYRAETFDDMGRLGGRLAVLSDKQLGMLDRLFAQLPKTPAEANGSPTPAVVAHVDEHLEGASQVSSAHEAPRQ